MRNVTTNPMPGDQIHTPSVYPYVTRTIVLATENGTVTSKTNAEPADTCTLEQWTKWASRQHTAWPFDAEKTLIAKN